MPLPASRRAIREAAVHGHPSGPVGGGDATSGCLYAPEECPTVRLPHRWCTACRMQISSEYAQRGVRLPVSWFDQAPPAWRFLPIVVPCAAEAVALAPACVPVAAAPPAMCAAAACAAPVVRTEMCPNSAPLSCCTRPPSCA